MNAQLIDRLHAEAENYGLHEDVRALLREAIAALAAPKEAGDAWSGLISAVGMAKMRLMLGEPDAVGALQQLNAVSDALDMILIDRRLAAPSKEAELPNPVFVHPEKGPLFDALQMRMWRIYGSMDTANPPVDQRQEGALRQFVQGLDCECDPDYSTRTCGRCAALAASPPTEAAAAVGEGPHAALRDELLDLAEWEFKAECCNSTFPINMLRRVCKQAAAALSPTASAAREGSA